MEKLNDFKIGNRWVGSGHRPFVIAEMSGNHNGSLDRALSIVDAAAQAGAHAIKLQTYTADSMTLDVDGGAFRIDDPGSLWKGSKLHQLYQEACTPYEWHQPIFDRCRKLGLEAFSTPFDEGAVEFLDRLGVPAFKIASFENTDLPLIRRVARTGKPLIVSTGMATVAELDELVRAAREEGARDIVLLKCTSTYPSTPENTNLLTIPHLRTLFGTHVGLSDHSMGIGVGVAAVALGAPVIEKHFTLRRADGGVDSAFSMEPEEMAALVVESERAWQAMGEVRYGPTEKEKKSLQFRRSLYVAENMKAGEAFTHQNLRAVRPGLGLPPKFIDVLLGKRVSRDVRRGEPVSWDLLG